MTVHVADLFCGAGGSTSGAYRAARELGVEPVVLPVCTDIDPRRLVLIDGVPHVLDIRFRMLAPRELARAMGFDADGTDYLFTGNVGEVTRQIGNAVSVGTAKALVLAILGGK